MSRLTEAFHRSAHKDAIMTAIKLVDDKLVGFANEHKLDAALAIVRAVDTALPVNRMFEGIETAFLAGAISFAASWIHQRVAPYEPGYVGPTVVPPAPPTPFPVDLPPTLPPSPPNVPPIEVTPPVPTTPPQTEPHLAPYDTGFPLPVPGYEALKGMGFKVGDRVYINTEFGKWEVPSAGTLAFPGYNPVDTIA